MLACADEVIKWMTISVVDRSRTSENELVRQSLMLDRTRQPGGEEEVDEVDRDFDDEQEYDRHFQPHLALRVEQFGD